MDKHYWVALYADDTYDELYNTKDGAKQWIQANRPNKKLRRLILDD
jgi:hypothetical protein